MTRLLSILCLLWVSVAQASQPPFSDSAYDGLGRRTGFRNADNHWMSFAHDGQGRVLAVTNALGQVKQYQYDAAGNLTAFSIPNSQFSIQYAYDAANRCTNTAYADGSWVRLSYDLNSNVKTAQCARATTTFSYDSMNRLTTSTCQITNIYSQVIYRYDLSGNTTNIVYPGNREGVSPEWH